MIAWNTWVRVAEPQNIQNLLQSYVLFDYPEGSVNNIDSRK